MNKIKYDLLPSYGIREVSKIFTDKLETYKENSWKSGLKWTDVLSSLKKHLNEFELGHDYNESNLLNMAEVAANALILCEYYNIFPQGDNRILTPTHKSTIALDLDGVVFDFSSAYESKFNTSLNSYWKGDYKMGDNLELLKEDKDFWVNLPVLNYPSFEVDYYVTARNIPKEWIEESLQKNGLPCAPVHTVDIDCSKIQTLKDLNVDIFIDDKWENFKEITESGIFCYLMTAEHNKHYNVGHRRINNLNIPLR